VISASGKGKKKKKSTHAGKKEKQFREANDEWKTVKLRFLDQRMPFS